MLRITPDANVAVFGPCATTCAAAWTPANTRTTCSSCYTALVTYLLLKTMQTREEIRTRLNENGTLVLPASVQLALGLRPGDEIVMRVENNELRMTTTAKRIERAQQLFRKYVGEGIRLSDELVADRRKEAVNG